MMKFPMKTLNKAKKPGMARGGKAGAKMAASVKKPAIDAKTLDSMKSSLKT